MGDMEQPASVARAELVRSADVPSSFEALFAEQHERLYRAVYLIVGNRHEAEELTQDAFLKVLERWERIDNPEGYLYRCALNATSSRFRRLAYAAKRTLTPGAQEDPFEAADLRDEMVRALRALPERQRAALVLLDLLDYRSEDAATLLGITPATVRSLASHGRAAMRLSLGAGDVG